MALRKKGDKAFGDSVADIRDALVAYATGGYPPTVFADAACACGGTTFVLAVDDDEGAAERRCTACDAPALIANSADVEDDMTLEPCGCPCGRDVFELTLGLALYAGSATDVRWIYVGARCVTCGDVGCYVDWKCDGSETASDLLTRA